MKNLIVLSLFAGVFLLLGCKKDDTDTDEEKFKDFIVAGDSIDASIRQLDFKMDNNWDSIYTEYTELGSKNTPLNVYFTSEINLRFLNSYGAYKGIQYSKFFGITSSSENIEYAIHKDTLLQNKSYTFVKFFNLFDTINVGQKWGKKDWSDGFVVSLFYENDPLLISINKNIDDKYIGFRVFVGSKYKYGWLKLSVKDHMYLQVKECCLNKY